MASRIYKKGLKGANYGTIQRGASFTLPVEVKDETDKPIDLSGLTVLFTAKKVKTDFDRHDDKAYIKKHFLPQDPVNGKFYVMLSSDDTDFEPGKFFFDVELLNKKNGMVFRLFTFEFELDGGPTNRKVNKGMGQWPTGDTITVITLAEGDPIIVIAPTINLDGDVFGQLATLMEAVDKCEKHVKECEILDLQVKEELEKVKETVDDLNGQIADHEEDISELLEHLAKHDESLKTILETLAQHLEYIKSLGEDLNKQAKTLAEHTENISDLQERLAKLEERFNFRWKE